MTRLDFDAISVSTLHIYVSRGFLDSSNVLKRTYGAESPGIVSDHLPTATGSQNDPHLADEDFEGSQLYRAFSPDGNYIASVTNDGTVQIRPSISTRIIATLEPPSRSIWIQFLPDSLRIACGSVDRTLTIWEVAQAKLVEMIILEPKLEPTPNARYAADVEFRVLGIFDGDSMYFWDTLTWKMRPTSSSGPPTASWSSLSTTPWVSPPLSSQSLPDLAPSGTLGGVPLNENQDTGIVRATLSREP